MKKVLCVIRESTLRQEVESQKMDMLPFLKSKGFKENQIVWMEVQGASAIKANDVYLNYLDDIKERSMEIGCVAFWHLNRLGRQKKYITMMEAFFKSNKIQVYIKNPDITLLDNEGKEKFEASLAFSIFAVMVESETEDLIELLSYGDIYVNIHKYIKVGYVYPIDNGRLLKLQNIDDEDINIAFLGKGRGVKILKNISPHKDGVYDITDWTDITKYYRDNDIEVFGKV